MKILALEKEEPSSDGKFGPHLKAEATRIWELYQLEVIREVYFRSDNHTAVLVLECEDLYDAAECLLTLPLVEAGLITFDLIPLAPYTGFERLFEK